MFFHHPFGTSDPGSVMNLSPQNRERDFVYFFDQEPIHLPLHRATFEDVSRRALDITWRHGVSGTIVTSERNSSDVRRICDEYGWRSAYYFFHGWAAMDWYRGYDRSFLIADATDRDIRHSFISPNRIVSGQREHRVILFYHLLRRGIASALISFPAVCPYNGQSMIEACQALTDRYPGLESTLDQAGLPWNFEGEIDHPMHSCWLSLFDECARSMCYVVTETVWQGHKHHLTEKIFKPICLQMPFVLVSTAGSLQYLRSYGFQTFGHIWDESYDLEQDDHARLEKISDLLIWFDSLSPGELQNLYDAALPVVTHNFRHFYQGGFEHQLWQELTKMLAGLGEQCP